MSSTADLISTAKQFLKQNPYDIAHDLSHHERVWKLAQQIVKSEKLVIDSDALKVACYWHDVVLEPKDETENRQLHINETLDHLSYLMNEKGMSSSFQERVVKSIRDHGFEKRKQLNLEGEVLFDADKLDALSSERIKPVVAAIKNKQLSRFKTLMYKQAAKLWLRTMKSRYHFKTSKEIHDAKIKLLLADKEAVQVAKDLGIDIADLVK